MASTFSPNLRLELMATGDQSGTWGETTNTNLGTLLEQAITGVASVVHDNTDTFTLSTIDGGVDQARNMVINVTGILSADRPVIIPSVDKIYVVKNSTTGGFGITPRPSAGTGPEIPAGESRLVYCNGTDAFLSDDFTVPLTKGGTGATNAPAARTNLGLGSIATQNANAVAITGGTLNGVTITGSTIGVTGGTIDNAVIGGTTPAAGTFTTLTATVSLNADGPVIITNPADTGADIYRSVGTSRLVVSGGSGVSSGGNIVLYGDTHPTTAGDITFRDNATTVARYDRSDNRWELNKNTVITGDLSATSINSTPIGSTTRSSGDFTIATANNYMQVASTGPNVRLIETDGTATHNQTRIRHTGDVFYLTTYDNNGVFVSNDYLITKNASGATEHVFRIGNTSTVQINATRLDMSGIDVRVDDNQRYYVGVSSDGSFFHDGTNTFLRNETGVFYVDANQNSGVGSLRGRNSSGTMQVVTTWGGGNGTFAMYYDGSLAASTSANGLDIQHPTSAILDINDTGGTGTAVDARTRFQYAGTAAGYVGYPGGSNLYVQNSLTLAGNIIYNNVFATGSHVFQINNTEIGRMNTTRLDLSGIDIRLDDQKRYYAGISQDGYFYHDGGNTILGNDTGGIFINNNVNSQFIRIQANNSAGALHTVARFGGASTTAALFYNADAVFFTTANGINVTNGTEAILDVSDETGTATNIAARMRLRYGTSVGGVFGFASSDDLLIQNSTAAGNSFYNVTNASGSHQFDIAGAEIARIKNNGLRLNDNERLFVGTGEDFAILHDTANTYLTNNTGALYLRNRTNSGAIRLETDDSGGTLRLGILVGASVPDVELYYNGGIRLRTTAAGGTLTNTWTAGGLVSTGDVDARGNMLVGSNGGGDSLIFMYDDSSNVYRTVIRWDDSLNEVTGYNLTGTEYPFGHISTATTAGTTVFPIGEYILATGGSNANRNASRAVYLASGNTTQYLDGTSGGLGTQLSGTWRACGIATSNVMLYRRVA